MEMNLDSTSPVTHSFEAFRAQMPVTKRWAYLDHAAVAPLPDPTRRVVATLAQQSADEGDTVWLSWAQRVEQIRATAALLINADPTEIAFVSNTTAGIGIVAEGFDFQPGDNVVTLANEFPSNQYPWLNLAHRGVETRRVEVPKGIVDLDRIAANCDARTRLISVSWVGFASGYRVDLSEIGKLARDHGAKLFLDAIQGLGVYPLDVKNSEVDFLAADGHKWMLGPEGAGILFIRKSLLPSLRPVGVGWNSVKNRGDYDHVEYEVREDAARYEGGSPNMLGIHGMGASLDLLASHGVSPTSSPVAKRVVELADDAADKTIEMGGEVLSPRLEGHRSGIVTVRFAGLDNQQLRKTCAAAGVAVSARGGGVRLSPHCYNTTDDIDRFLDVVQRTRSGKSP